MAWKIKWLEISVNCILDWCVDPYTSIANNNSYVFKSLINRLERDGLLAIYWFEKNHMKLN